MARFYLNNDWFFTESFSQELIHADPAQGPLTPVRLPHTCRELPYHYFREEDYQMVCGYVRHLYAPAEWEGKAALLTLEGAAHDAALYVNGRLAAVHHTGYTAFTTDIAPYLHYGEENRIVVRLDTRESLNTPPFGFVIDYLTYGGLYRDVYLEVKEKTHISDVFLHAEGSMLTAEAGISGPAEALCLRISMREHGKEAEGFVGLGEGPADAPLTVDAGNVRRWTIEDPRLYDVRTELLDLRGQVLDTVETVFGFRRAEFRRDGFYLNDEKVRIRGLNRHQSFPYVGYAMPDSMQARDAEILKHELGVNVVRTSHYPQSQAFIDRCDELGLLVFTEFPGWQHIGDEEWKDQALQNLREMITQYRNHPSIILWGVRINESVDDDPFYTRTNALAHRLDPTRQTGGVRCYKKGSFLEDVYTYNDFCHTGTDAGCLPRSEVTPDPEKPYMVTEYNGHMFPTKSFDCEEHRLEHALRHANVLDAVAAQEDIAGSFGWCMFDYNTHKDFGSGDKICHHGVMDMFRNPKLAAAVYASQQEHAPVLAVSSSMDIGEHPGSNRGDVYLFTNADSVKMYKNGEFLAEFDQTGSGTHPHLLHSPLVVDNSIEKSHTEGAYTGDWGSKSAGYRFEALKDGEVAATRILSTVGEPQLWIDVDRTDLVEGKSYDVAAIRLRMTDEHGNVLPFANDPLHLAATGSIEIIGPHLIALQGGMFGTYVRTTGIEGEGVLTITDARGDVYRIEFHVTKTQHTAEYSAR